MFRRVCFLFQFIWYAQAEYNCVCSFDGARPVFSKADKTSDVIGFLTTNGCRQYVYPVDETWNAIVFMHQLGFIMSNKSMIQTCFSDPIDSFTTDGTSMGTHSSQSTTRTTPTSLTISNPSTTTTTRFETIASQRPTTITTTRETTLTTTSTTTATTTDSTISTTLLTSMPATTTHTSTTTNMSKKKPIPSTTSIHTPATTPTTTTKSTTTTTPTTTTKYTTTTTPTTTTKSTTNTTPTTTTTPSTTTTHATTTTPTTTTTPRPTTTTTATTTTTTSRSTTQTTRLTSPTSTASTVSEGHTELCPDPVRNAINKGGFLGQYGHYCFELVNNITQWHNAQRTCNVSGVGYLAHVTNQAEQDYIVRFLDTHHYVQSIWLGLTDSKLEGQWSWMSGDSVTYTNFGQDYNNHGQSTHNYNDCVIMKKGGEWTDVPCGTSSMNVGIFGEKHPFICQYKIVHHLTEIG